MKLTESHLRNLIKQELKQFLKLNENDGLDSLDTEIPDKDKGKKLSDEEIALNALEPDLKPYVSPYNKPGSTKIVSPYKPGSTKIVSPGQIRDDADELGVYDMNIPLHVAARAASRRARKI